jgi:Flp pilus assembly pilin Flp
MLNHIRERPASAKNGQGLAEYALILSLVSVIVIAVLILFGDEVVVLYCRVLSAIDPNIEAPMCQRISVSCSGVGNGSTVSGNISVEANVNDTVPPNNIDYVVFKIDGATVNTEKVVKYCLNGGDGPCQKYNTTNLSNGSHTLEAFAYDKDGNAGACKVSFKVSN